MGTKNQSSKVVYSPELISSIASYPRVNGPACAPCLCDGSTTRERPACIASSDDQPKEKRDHMTRHLFFFSSRGRDTDDAGQFPTPRTGGCLFVNKAASMHSGLYGRLGVLFRDTMAARPFRIRITLKQFYPVSPLNLSPTCRVNGHGTMQRRSVIGSLLCTTRST